MSVTETAATTTTTVSVAVTTASDGTINPIVKRQDSYWTITSANSLAGGTYILSAGGTGFGTVGALTDLRVMNANSIVGNDGAVTTPTPVVAASGSLTNFLAVRKT